MTHFRNEGGEGNFVVNVTPLTTEINVFSTATEDDPNIVSFPLYIDDATAVRVMFDGTWRNAFYYAKYVAVLFVRKLCVPQF